jgi:5-methylcytosine-specific restriction enzyme A
MARNPTWSRDELILALDLYWRHRERLPDSEDVEIVELSQTLNSLFGEQAKDAALFRNRNGVYMKLANFRAVDPLHTSQGKRGLSRGGNGVAELWDEFSNRGDELKLIASAIRAAAGDQAAIAIAEQEEGITEAEEGRLLTRMHRVRERNRELVRGTLYCAKRDDSPARLAASISMTSTESMVAGSLKCIMCSRFMRLRPARGHASRTWRSSVPIAIEWSTRNPNG